MAAYEAVFSGKQSQMLPRVENLENCMATTQNMQEHWQGVYAEAETTKLGWYEAVPDKSLSLLSKCEIDKDDAILDVGCGASTLADALLDRGFSNVIATDLSAQALQKSQVRLGPVKASRVTWLVDDVTRPQHLTQLSGVAVWHDRAVLHFLLQEEQRQGYLRTLNAVLKPGGYAIIATFSLEGAKKCSGLDLHNYDEKMLADFLGQDYILHEHFNHTYYQPSGAPRPFVYTLFRKHE
jgi:cyclopropane fatty-acyl-phospholipid synthase-like methyltransferase